MKISKSEWQIMNALWKHHPATARELMGVLPEETNWAYNTVKTLLARLKAKGAISESKQGNTSVFKPLLSRQKARRKALHSFVNQVFDGTVEPLLSFIVKEKSITGRQRQELLKILQQEEEKKRGGQK